MKEINIPYLKYFTHAYIYGQLPSDKTLIILHGGPGANTGLYRPLTDLTKYGYTVILYDQLGCGKSSNLKAHPELYKMATYTKELDNLIKTLKIKDYYLLGHSWGGMLALSYIHQFQPKGLKKLILFSSLYSTKAWNETNLKRCLKILKGDERKYWKACYDEGEFGHRRARKIFKEKILPQYKVKTNTSPYPHKRIPYYDGNIIYKTMWGKNDMFGFGTLYDWNEEATLKSIKVPTLIFCGQYDQSRLEMNQRMHQLIKGSKLVYLKNSAHCGYFNEYPLVMKELNNFLRG